MSFSSSTAHDRNVVMKDYSSVVPKGLFSTDMRGKPMTTNTFYKQIRANTDRSNMALQVASIGFYKAGKLLNRAKKELKGDFGKLKKKLADDGFHIKQQERYMAIARNKNIHLNYNKLPPQWTFWEKLSHLDDEQFSKINHLINKEAKWKELEIYLGSYKKTPGGSRTSINDRDNRTEVFGLEYDFKVATKKHKDEFRQLEKDMKKLAKKYKFIKLKTKNYFFEASAMLENKKTKDDTSKVDKPKFKKSYNPKRKINL